MRGGGDSGLCHFSIFDSENVSLFEKTAFFHEKRPKYLVLNLKNFRGAFGAAKYPHIPIFLRFISFLFNKFFEKEKIFCLYPFLPKFFFYWNNIRFLFVHLPWYSQIFGEGGGYSQNRHGTKNGTRFSPVLQKIQNVRGI